MYSAYKNNIPEYRIGSAILHDNGNELEIVDGQQRVTTLSILIYCFSCFLKNDDYKKLPYLLNRKDAFDSRSSKSIIENFELLKRHCEIIGNELPGFAIYVLENCTFVKIVTGSEQEAFQFFDSQNSRGKPLDPHDLLKSYHLREMTDCAEDEKTRIISSWENESQKELASFFANNLYPLVQWYKDKDGLNYSSKKIKAFKGIRQHSNYHYSIYHKAANLYIEHFNSEGMYELTCGEKIHQFQLTQPLIAGKRFFLYSLYYFNLYKRIEKLVQQKFETWKIPSAGSGDIYVKNLFMNIVLFFVDKFNMDELTDSRLKFLYDWAYSLRVVMHSVYPQTVNKYALGSDGCRVNAGLNLFARISEMQNPMELDSIILDKVSRQDLDSYKSTKYHDIWDFVFGGKQ